VKRSNRKEMTKFKEVKHLYLGCKVRVDMTSSNMGYKDGAFTGLSKSLGTYFTQVEFGKANFQEFHNYPVKPYLLPLSAMTDEQMVRVGLIIRNIKPEDATYADKLFALDDAPFFAIKKGMKCTLSLAQCVELTNYFRSQYFDIDGLIESGEAIDATTLTPNPYAK